jgi:hypothetical protein
LTIAISVTCESTTLNASSGSLSCNTPIVAGEAEAFASAHADFGPSGFAEVDTDANCGLSAEGTCDVTALGRARIDASYQITFTGSTGPGYIQPVLCADIHGNSSGSFVTPNGSIDSIAGCTSTEIPIVFRVPLDAQLTLQSFSFNVGRNATDGVGASLDFRVLDAQMNPVPVTAIVVIPEPSTARLLMVAMGLFIMGVRLEAWPGRQKPTQSAEALGRGTVKTSAPDL